MVPTQLHYPSGDWIGGLVAGLLVLLLFSPGTWAQGPRQPTEDTRPRRAAPGRAVVVHDGRLSVDVQAADLGEVLAQIGQQAGIRIAAGAGAGKKVSARFADVELEEGFRRLLRLASLSHLFLYASGPAGTAVLTEVRVVGAGTAESGASAHEPSPGAPVRQGRQPARSGMGLPEGTAAPEAPEPVLEVVETEPEPAPAEPSEAMRRVLDAFTRGKQMGAPAAEDPASAPPEPTPESGPVPEDGGAVSR